MIGRFSLLFDTSQNVFSTLDFNISVNIVWKCQRCISKFKLAIIEWNVSSFYVILNQTGVLFFAPPGTCTYMQQCCGISRIFPRYCSSEYSPMSTLEFAKPWPPYLIFSWRFSFPLNVITQICYVITEIFTVITTICTVITQICTQW